jgi:hypothetical protein
MRKEFCPSLQVACLRLIESHGFIHTHLAPQQAFNFVFCERAEVACVRFEPNVLRSVRAPHPMGKPMVELARRPVRICRISIGCEDFLFLGSGHASRAVFVRHAGERRVHFARCQPRIRHCAESAALIDLDLRTVLLRRSLSPATISMCDRIVVRSLPRVRVQLERMALPLSEAHFDAAFRPLFRRFVGWPVGIVFETP